MAKALSKKASSKKRTATKYDVYLDAIPSNLKPMFQRILDKVKARKEYLERS
jgi:hypothetical protein